MNNKKYILAFILSLCATLSYADSTTNITTNAAISSTCSISGGTLNFGSVTPGTGNTTAKSTLVTLCTSNTPYDIAFSAGSSSNELNRIMLGQLSGDSLQYNIYTDSTYTTIIGDGQSGTSHPLNGSSDGRPVTNGALAGRNLYASDSGRSVTWSIFGSLSNSQYVSPDNYSDTLTVNLTY